MTLSLKSNPVAPPLCTDLDGTILATDLLWESFLAAIRRHPMLVLMVPIWILRGKAYLKHQLALHSALRTEHLPCREEVVAFLRSEQEKGRRVILVTAADALLATRMAEQLAIPEVLASDGARNMKGRHKCVAIIDFLGDQPFDYIGDSAADLPVLEAAATALLAGPARGRLNRRLGGRATLLDPPAPPPPRARVLVKACRVHQWSKNILLFVPAIVGHRFYDTRLWLDLLLAFISFSLMASAVYLLNDMFDLASDRQHPHKRKRPLASGLLRIQDGFLLAALQLILCLSLAFFALPGMFMLMLLVYGLLTTLYSVYFKRKLMVDVIVLAGLYTLRVLSGGYPFDIELSFWLLAFSMFLFLSLAFAKRYSEVLAILGRDGNQTPGRGYSVADLEMIRSFGPMTGCLAVLVFALYINSDAVVALYPNPQILWLVCPVFLYWISRIWFIAHRGQLPEDPVLFALKDKNSMLAGILVFILVALATQDIM
jgi:4-hydroxybenzoate polyprenyltransferase/phosphoserine phosphatase